MEFEAVSETKDILLHVKLAFLHGMGATGAPLKQSVPSEIFAPSENILSVNNRQINITIEINGRKPGKNTYFDMT